MTPFDLLAQPLTLTRGPVLPNRFMLAPLTNRQSHADGTLSDEEYRWLTMRAEGGFGLTMTCAAHVLAQGQGFGGQLGVFSDAHLEGLTRLADGIRAAGSVSSLQLHHAGIRSPKELVGDVVGPSDDAETGARAMTTAEVEAARDAYIAGAARAEKAGFDGVEVHGAHGYLICAFLSPELNRREDRYGGSPENRARLLFEVVNGVRAACGPNFQLGLRLSLERFGLRFDEMMEVTAEVLRQGVIDYLDMSLWDVRKEPSDPAHKGRTMLERIVELPRGAVRLGAAGKVMTAKDAADLLGAGCDFVVIGRGAVLRHDFPRRVMADAGYASPPNPVSEAHLAAEGLSPAFVTYMRGWAGFVEEPADASAG